MARSYRYNCSNCGRQPGDTPEIARQNLFVKKIEFRRYGFKGALIRSRTQAWLCKECMTKDPEYNLPEKQISDGMVQ